MASFATDLSNSTRDFKRLVAPILRRGMGGELIPVEGNTDDRLCTLLDTLSGIDAWHMRHDHGLRGIGSRIQWMPAESLPYNTFTIRYRRESGAMTEFEKRCQAIRGDGGWIYPHLTVHAYVREPALEGELLSLGIARTADVMDYITRYNPPTRKVAKDGAAEFFCVNWGQYRKCGYEIKQWLLDRTSACPP